MVAMNWIDYTILAIMFFSVIIGGIRGLVKELLSLIVLIAAFFIAIKYSDMLANYFNQTSLLHHNVSDTNQALNMDASRPTSYLMLCISFIVLFVGTILIGAVITFFINFFFQAGVIGIGNHFLGMLFGLVAV